MTFLAELKRRNVVKTAVLYAVVSWLIMQVADVGISLLGLPDWVGRGVVLLLVLGLPLVLVFSWVYELTPEGLKREQDVERGSYAGAATGRKINILIVALLLLAIALVLVDRLVPESETLVQSPDPDPLVSNVPATSQSIAVLPFVNMSNDPDQEYFSDGISEELLNVLAQYTGLRVAARTSSFQFKGQTADIADIAEALHVDHILEGSVRKSGNTLRITAQLVEARSGFQLWSDTFDRQLTDVFAIQDEISSAIGEALKIQLALDDDGQSSPAVSAAATAAAFDAYVHGRQLINLRGKANLEQAIVFLDKAIALDEAYAPAHAQLAIAYALLSDSPGSYGDLSLELVKQKAVPHIERALELDPVLPEAFAARAILGLTVSEFETSVANSKRTLELNPSYADAWNWLYISSVGIGRYAEASEALEKLLRVDPLSVVGRYNYARTLQLHPGQMQDAIETADSLFEQSPTFGYYTHAQIAYYVGAVDEALEWSLKTFSSSPLGKRIAAEPIGRSFGQLDLLGEALRFGDDAHYWAYLNQRMWTELIEQARKRLALDSTNENNKLLLANALHLAGDVEQAQALYEELLTSRPGMAIIDPNSESVAPTARAAWGRFRVGDEVGGRELIELTREDLRQRSAAQIIHGEFYRAAAIISVLEKDDEGALENLARAIEQGPRDPSLFSEPAFEPLRDSERFQALESRLMSILAAQRASALQMICFDNPVPDAWQPLPESCDGVERESSESPGAGG